MIGALIAILYAQAAASQNPPTLYSPVRVTVRSMSQAAEPAPGIDDAYVALIAKHEPLSRPSFDAMTVRGHADLAVRPGEYFLLVAADGFQDELRELDVAEKNHPVVVVLEPEVMLTGIVVGADGQPIAGARVRHAGAAPAFSRRDRSDYATQRLKGRRETETDEKGAWRLPAVGHHDFPILIEARGHSPAWVTYSEGIEGEVPDPFRTVLQKGATLNVSLDRTDGKMLVSAVPVAIPANTAVPPEWRNRVWSRAASTSSIEWESLPPGDYRIVAEHSDPLRFMAPAELGRVSLRAGARGERAVTLPADPPPAATSYVTLLIPRSIELDQPRAFWRRSGGTQEVPHAIEEAIGGTVIYAKAAAMPSDVYVTTRTRFITAVSRGHVETPGEELPETLVLYRANGKLRIGVPPGGTIPTAASARYRRCAGGDQVIVLPADVQRDGTIALPLLTQCLALTLGFDGYAPLTFVPTARAGEDKWLGDHLLRSPASAEIRVLAEPDKTPVADAVVRALVTPDRRNEVVVAESRVDERGIVVLNNLPPAQEMFFEARMVGTDRSGTVTRAIRPGERVTIDPLTIPAAASLRITPDLDPAFASDHPSGEIKSIMIRRVDGTRDDKRDFDLSAAQTAVFENVPAGKWNIIAVLALEEAVQPIDVETVELKSGEQKELKPLIKPLVFDGQVIENGEGVAVSLGIGDPPGPHAIRRRIATGADGMFRVTLPRSGFYHVQVQRIPGGVPTAPADQRIEVGPVSFDSSQPFVMIEIPSGVLSLKVRSGDQPVPNAEVTATMRNERLFGTAAPAVMKRIQTDAAGGATLQQLPEGTWVVEARERQSGRSVAKSATVRRSGRTDVVLNIETGGVVEGRIAGSNGVVVVGARVDCFYLAGELPREVFAETDLDGQFSISIAKPAPATLQCGVTTPDGTVEAFTARPGQSASVTLSPAAGSLRIADWGTAVSANRYWLVSSDGRAFNLSWAARKFGRPWAALEITSLPAGQWKVVRVESDSWTAIGRGLAGSLPLLASVRLDAGQNQEVTIHRQP